MLNISYVYDLPFFRSGNGWSKALLGGWLWSGITSIQTGTSFDVIDSSYSDNPGVSSAITPGTFADIVGNPHSGATAGCAVTGTGPQLFNPCAFAHPRGLTFGNAGRNILHNPRTTNFDMSLLKHFRITEPTRVEFRAEASTSSITRSGTACTTTSIRPGSCTPVARIAPGLCSSA
jgi:hypothetical protein